MGLFLATNFKPVALIGVHSSLVVFIQSRKTVNCATNFE